MQYKFLIYISYSYAVPIGNPLEAEINKRGYSVKWFSDHQDGKKALKSKHNVLHSIEDALNYEPHIVLTATDSVPDFFNALKVQIFHGFNAEKRPTSNNSFAHFRLRGFFDLYCTQGPNTTYGFEEQAKKHPYFEVAETGWSKVDPLFPIEASQTKTVPVVMIASTFTERLSLAHNAKVFDEIKRLSTSGNYKFITVLHPKIPQTIVSKWESLNNENFTYHQTTDLIPLFKKADIMFADTTSAIQEFLLQKKPVVTFNHTFDHDYLINIKEAEAIESAFKNALHPTDDLITNISNYIHELHPYFDGQSSKRVIDACLNYIHKDKSHLRSKPLNLMRKFKIRQRLKYYSLKSYNKPFTLAKDHHA